MSGTDKSRQTQQHPGAGFPIEGKIAIGMIALGVVALVLSVSGLF
jgi:hypothetical protein